MLEGAKRDQQSITADWTLTRVELITGVRVREVKNVMKESGVLTEIFRRDWSLDDAPVDQVFQVTLFPGQITAWHTHLATLDRLFVTTGHLKIVLFDAREDSPTHGLVNEFRFGTARPALLIIPPGVWHGVQNVGPETGVVLNLVDRAYEYENPDHWRLPDDTPEIPYQFSRL